jgi:hypothetical protein
MGSHRTVTLPGFLLVATVALSACGPRPAATTDPAASDCIRSEQGECLPVAPESQRVDLVQPTFSDPTSVTNPLHPTGLVQSAVMLGRADGRPFRTEITLLPETRTIQWNGQRIEALESQYVAFVDGRIHEVALDWYAQADDGSVWYLGEDVFNYEDGIVADTHGTWMAGRDGPAAMIMPASPQVGDVYRPENAPGLVFEEVTVTSIGVTVDGPHGPVTDAIVVRELHMDGTHEDKTFAPGYGEFSTGSGDNLEALAMAVPTDALAGPVPAELASLLAAAAEVDDGAAVGEWTRASAALETVTSAWEAHRQAGVPPMLETQMRDALDALASAIESRDAIEARQAALSVARAALDLQLRHRPSAEIDLARMELWARQVLLDATAGDPAAVAGDVATMEWTRDRFAHILSEGDLGELDGLLGELRAAADSEDLPAAAATAAELRELIAGLEPVG